MSGAPTDPTVAGGPGTVSDGQAGLVRGFGDRVAAAVARRGSQIVLGLDPDPMRLWPRAREIAEANGSAGSGAPGGLGRSGGAGGSVAERAARVVAAHCRLVLEAAAEHCVAVKPQVACFERLGPPGWVALAEVVRDARERDLIVIADAKRGDIDISARAYGQAFFGATPTPYGDVPGLGVDALTANPLLGADALAPLVQAARAAGAGILTLVRTSNPGAGDVQDRALAEGGSVSEALADIVDALGRDGVGQAGLSDVGAVTGATAPDRLETLRGHMPQAILLLPGIGPQGGSGRGLAAAFAPGPAAGLVSASRAIVFAHAAAGAAGGDPAAAARGEAARLRELIWSLYA